MYKYIARAVIDGCQSFINYNGLPVDRIGVLCLFNGRDEAEKALASFRRYASPDLPDDSFMVEPFALDTDGSLSAEYRAGKRWAVCHRETVSPVEDDYSFVDYYRTQDGAKRAYTKYKINESRSYVCICSVDQRGNLVTLKRKRRAS